MSKYKRIALIILCGVIVGIMTFSTFAYSGTPNEIPTDTSKEYVSYLPISSMTFKGRNHDGSKQLVAFDFPDMLNETTTYQAVTSTTNETLNGEPFTPIYELTTDMFNVNYLENGKAYADIDFTIQDEYLLYNESKLDITFTVNDFICKNLDEWYQIGSAIQMYGLMGGNSYTIITCEITLLDRSTIYNSVSNTDGTTTDYAEAVVFGLPSATVVWTSTGGGITNNYNFETNLDWGFYVNGEHHNIEIPYPNVSEINGNDIAVYISDMQIMQSIDVPAYQQVMPLTMSYRILYQSADKAPTSTNLKEFTEARFGTDTIIFVPDEFDYEPTEQISTSWNFAKFIDGSLSIFTTPIFGSFSLGHILLVVIGIGVLFAVIKIFTR